MMKLAQNTAAVMTSVKNWALNYGGQIESVLGGDRFEPTKEGYRD
jgi:hypothetical protein